MSRSGKLAQEFLAARNGFAFRKLVTLLGDLGYRERSSSGGSGRCFVHSDKGHVILLHEPHPGKDVKAYMVRHIRHVLIERGEL